MLTANTLQFGHYVADKAFNRQVRNADHDIITVTADRNENSMSAALSNSSRHFRCYLSEHSVRDDNSDGTDNNVRPSTSDHDGVFSGCGVVRARLDRKSVV